MRVGSPNNVVGTIDGAERIGVAIMQRPPQARGGEELALLAGAGGHPRGGFRRDSGRRPATNAGGRACSRPRLSPHGDFSMASALRGSRGTCISSTRRGFLGVGSLAWGLGGVSRRVSGWCPRLNNGLRGRLSAAPFFLLRLLLSDGLGYRAMPPHGGHGRRPSGRTST
jgi:hypothetical protein